MNSHQKLDLLSFGVITNYNEFLNLKSDHLVQLFFLADMYLIFKLICGSSISLFTISPCFILKKKKGKRKKEKDKEKSSPAFAVSFDNQVGRNIQ